MDLMRDLWEQRFARNLLIQLLNSYYYHDHVGYAPRSRIITDIINLRNPRSL